MASSVSEKAEIFFFPFLGGGHLLPMIDLARLFASHGASSVILAAENDESVLLKSMQRDKESGLLVRLQTLRPPLGSADFDTTDMSSPPLTDTSALKEPLLQVLLSCRPDCIIMDTFHRWAAEVIDDIGIPRIIFNGNCCFSLCCEYSLVVHKPHNNLESESERFTLPGLPDKIELTRSQLSPFVRNGLEFPGKSKRSEQNILGQVINSFYSLEPAYVDHYRNVLGKKAWVVGPVSLFNRNIQDRVERGLKSAVDEHSCLNWLNSHQPNSVIYMSFGSLDRVSKAQIFEIACGLESAGHPFVWVIGKLIESDHGKLDDCFPDGFEEKISKSNQGLIIKGWAPQLLILEHQSVGGFVTHCGWNSTLEGICAGVPMITWPLSAEQFTNEKLVTDILQTGLKVGSEEWAFWNAERKVIMEREKVEAAVVKLMSSVSGAEMRKRAKYLAAEAKKAVEEGESSYTDIDALLDEIKPRK